MRGPLSRDQDASKASLDNLIKAAAPAEGFEHEYLESRWKDQVLWAERRANKAQNRHYVFRITTIVGGVIVPSVVSLAARAHGHTRNWFDWAAIVIGLVVAMCAALEEFFHYGERWRHYRQTAEWLKAEGWNLLTRTGHPYSRKSDSRAFSQFVERVERILQRDVEGYLRAIAQERPAQSREDGTKSDQPGDPPAESAAAALGSKEAPH
jgi:hypothetical protein